MSPVGKGIRLGWPSMPLRNSRICVHCVPVTKASFGCLPKGEKLLKTLNAYLAITISIGMWLCYKGGSESFRSALALGVSTYFLSISHHGFCQISLICKVKQPMGWIRIAPAS